MLDWLIAQGALDYLTTYTNADITADDRAQFAELRAQDNSTSSGGVAVIPMKGILTQNRDIMAMIFGGGNTVYSSIIQGLQAADADANIESAELDINSPGGTVEGMFETMAAIQAFSKPITARVTGKAASAAFIIATQADEIIAASESTEFGSLGVAFETRVNDNIVTITNTKSPDKRPDLETEEGQQVVRDRLDGIYNLFVEAVATGRNTTVKKVNADFGQGRVFLAQDSVKRGMIDTVVDTTTSKPATGGNPTKKGTKVMNLDELKANHPDLYAQAVAIGQTNERDRVGAHLAMGEASGDMKTAVTAIEDGVDMTQKLQATYMAAGLRRNAIDDRQNDSDNADDIDNGGDTAATDIEDKVHAAALELMGVIDDD